MSTVDGVVTYVVDAAVRGRPRRRSRRKPAGDSGQTDAGVSSPSDEVDVRNFEDVIIVDLSGRLVAGDGADVLHEVINTLLADDWEKIILNMSDVSMIDSTGAGELIESLKIADKSSPKLKLLRPHERVRRASS